MSTEREDGPIKHYRYVCDKCGKQSKRGVDEPPYLKDCPGWVEMEDEEENYTHYCPKCSNAKVEKVREVVPNLGDSLDVSDHAKVYRPLLRLEKNKLVIDLQDGQKLIFTSNTAIKVEQHDED